MIFTLSMLPGRLLTTVQDGFLVISRNAPKPVMIMVGDGLFLAAGLFMFVVRAALVAGAHSIPVKYSIKNSFFTVVCFLYITYGLI